MWLVEQCSGRGVEKSLMGVVGFSGRELYMRVGIRILMLMRRLHIHSGHCRIAHAEGADFVVVVVLALGGVHKAGELRRVGRRERWQVGRCVRVDGHLRSRGGGHCVVVGPM